MIETRNRVINFSAKNTQSSNNININNNKINNVNKFSKTV